MNHDSDAMKQAIELDNVEAFALAVRDASDIEIAGLRNNPDDPPDVHGFIDGTRIGIEVVQLIRETHGRRAAQGETPYAERLFEDSQWSMDGLAAEIRSIIEGKGDKYARCDLHIDLLLIVSREPWLQSGEVARWLPDIAFEPHPAIESVFLLLDYEPGRETDRHPVFTIYGSLCGFAS